MDAKTVLAALAIMASLISACAAEVRILSASGMREVVRELEPQISRATGQQVIISFGEAGDLSKRIQNGEAADVIILPRSVMDQVAAQQNVVPGSVIDLA